MITAQTLLVLDIEQAIARVRSLSSDDCRRVALDLAATVRREQEPSRVATSIAILQAIVANDSSALKLRDKTAIIKAALNARRLNDPALHHTLSIAVPQLLSRFGSLPVNLAAPAIRYVTEEAPSKGLPHTKQHVDRLLARKGRFRLLYDQRKLFRSRGRRSVGNLNLNVVRAGKNASTDAIEDWYKDPWHWGENSWISTTGNRLIGQRIDSLYVGRVVRLDVAKGGHATRPALIVDPIDRIAYQALVDLCSVDAIGTMPSWVYGWRLHRAQPIAGLYIRNGNEWRRYKHHKSVSTQQYKYCLQADIRAFFPSVSLDRLVEQLVGTVEKADVAFCVEQFLRGWETVVGRNGLPQRLLGSSILAHFYLRPLDEVLRRVCESSALPMQPMRWMDDVSVFGDDYNELRRMAAWIDECLESIGLELNTSKTSIVECARLSPMSTSGVDDELLAGDTSDLLRIVDEISAQPMEAPRSIISFVCKRARSYGDLSAVVTKLEEHKDSMPHGADHLARLFRETGAWMNLGQWYLDYAKRYFADSNWSVQAWGLMFPAAHDDWNGGEIGTEFTTGVSTGAVSEVTLPLATRRLVDWVPESAVDALRSAADHVRSPFEMRAVALSALSAGADRNEVQKWLKGYPENESTLRFLQATGFAVPKLAFDFRGR